MDESDKLAVEKMIEVMKTNEDRIFDGLMKTFNWLLATNFAANGGALLALISASGSGAIVPSASKLAFALGVIASLFAGMASSLNSYRGYERVYRVRMELEQALIGGEIDQQAMLRKIEALRMRWWQWSPTGFLAISTALFVAGVLTAVCH